MRELRSGLSVSSLLPLFPCLKNRPAFVANQFLDELTICVARILMTVSENCVLSLCVWCV